MPFRRLKSVDISEHAALFEAFAASRYFMLQESYFLHLLKDAPPAMADFVLKMVEETLDAVDASDQRRGNFGLYEVSDLVFKIYASNLNHPDRMRRALDLIDRMIDTGLLEGKLDAA